MNKSYTQNTRPVTTVSCLVFSLSDRAKELCTRRFADAGVRLRVITPTSIEQANEILETMPTSIVLAEMNSLLDDDWSLAPEFPVRHLTFPPLVVLSDGALSVDEREALRLLGTTWVLPLLSPSSLVQPDIDSVIHANLWFTSPIGRTSVGDALQLMDHAAPGMLSVTCPHARALAATEWSAPRRTCLGGVHDECSGWVARAYVREGQLFYAEAPGLSGHDALAAMLEAEHGQVRIHETFLEPATQNLSGSIQNNMLDAARIADERARDASGRATSARSKKAPKANKPKLPPVPDIRLVRGHTTTSRPMTQSTKNAQQQRPSPAHGAPSIRAVSASAATESSKKTRSPSRPQGESSMPAIDRTTRILQGVQELSAVALADGEGNVQSFSGAADAEILCAVSAMCNQPISTVGEMLALGDMNSWIIVTDSSSVAVVSTPGGFVSGVGRHTANPNTIVRKMSHLASEEQS